MVITAESAEPKNWEYPLRNLKNIYYRNYYEMIYSPGHVTVPRAVSYSFVVTITFL